MKRNCSMQKPMEMYNLYWRLRYRYRLPKFLAHALARFWLKRARPWLRRVRAQVRRYRRPRIVVRGLAGQGTLVCTVDVRIAQDFYTRMWLGERLLRLGAHVLNVGFEKREAGEWCDPKINLPPLGIDVLLWDGWRCVVGRLYLDGQFYASQEAAPITVKRWTWLFPFPGENSDAQE